MARIDTGVYQGTIEHAVLAQVGDKNTEFMKIFFTVTHMAKGGEWYVMPETKREIQICVNEKSWPIAEQKLKCLGFNGDFENPEFSVNPFVAQCAHEQIGDKTYERWDPYNWEQPREVKAAPQSLARTLTNRWKQNQPSAPTGKPPAAPSGVRVEKALSLFAKDFGFSQAEVEAFVGEPANLWDKEILDKLQAIVMSVMERPVPDGADAKAVRRGYFGEATDKAFSAENDIAF